MTADEKREEIARLKAFFQMEMPDVTVDGYMTLHDVALFVKATFLCAESGIDNHWNEGAVLRLEQLECFIRQQQS